MILKSSDLEGSTNGPKDGEKEPNCADDARQNHTRNGPVSGILTSGNLPAVIFQKIWRSNAKSRPNCAHDAGVRFKTYSVVLPCIYM